MDTDKTSLTIAKNLKKIREDLGMSQEELANIAGLHRTYISMIERSEKNITVLCLGKIANALNVDIIELLHETV